MLYLQKQSLRRYSLVGFLLVNVFICTYGWWKITGLNNSSSALNYVSLGRITGLIASIAILIEIFTMARAPLIENNFSVEELVSFHKLVGYATIIGLAAHVLFLTIGYSLIDHKSWWNEFLLFNSGFEDVLKATIGSAIFFGAVFLSISIARKRIPYQYWFISHLTLYIAIIFTFPHIVNSGGDFIGHPLFSTYAWAIYGLALGVLGFYRFLRPAYYLWKYDFRVDSIKAEAKAIHSIYITGKNIDQFKFKSGQFGVWWFLDKNLWHEGHPFSFSHESNGKFLRITFKESGDFTAKLATQLKPGTRVILDGPRGRFTASQASSSDVVLIAGGIGVTPLRAMLKDFSQAGQKVKLIYAVKTKQDVAFYNELKSLAKNGNLDLNFQVEEINGRLDGTKLQALLQPSVTAKSIYICGPPSMMESLSATLRALGVPKKNILTENFSF